MKKTVIILGVVVIVLLGILVFYNPAQGPTVNTSPTSTGGATSPTPPLVSSDGHVTVTSPRANDIITSPVMITGSVKGGAWFFEATFPVKVLDAAGKTIGSGTAQAQPPEAWMSTGTVPFIANITFTAPKSATGTIVLKNDNPSGDPARDVELAIPVVFAPGAGK